MKQFLVIQTAYIGDVILATPIATELKRIYPDSKIDFVVRKGNEILLENNPNIDEVITFNKSIGKIKALKKTIKQVNKKTYDEVINLQRYTSAGIICFRSKASHKVGFKKNAFPFVYDLKIAHEIKQGLHEVTRNLQTIKHHGANQLIKPQLFPSEKDYIKVQQFKENQRYFCLAPASVWYTKQLPKEKWVELINILTDKGKVYLLGSTADTKLCQNISNQANGDVEILAGKLTILQSAALMEGAKMNYVNDSGPQHIASAVNAPVRSFFCSTVSDFGFGPLSDNSKVIEVKESLRCRPCGIHGHKKCPEGHFKCGLNIKIDDTVIPSE